MFVAITVNFRYFTSLNLKMLKKREIFTCLILTIYLASGSGLTRDEDEEIEENYFRDADITEDLKFV